YSHLAHLNISLNSGDDIAGTIHAVGAKVSDLEVGDRVAAMHKMLAAGGAYAEYAVAPASTTLRLPERVSFEEAATIPLVLLTAAVTLYRRQKLPEPWSLGSGDVPPTPTPLIVYGASSALGCFAIKLAKASNVHPIVAIAGGSSEYVGTLLDATKGDRLVDYRNGVQTMQKDVLEALGGLKVRHAVDCISSNGTWVPLAQLLDCEGKGVLSVVSGSNKYDEVEIPRGVNILYTYVGTVHEGAYKPSMPKQPVDKEEVERDIEWVKVFVGRVGEMLERGEISGHPFRVVPGGLEGVEEGLRKLKSGEAKGYKFVYRVLEE
ncbi:hypothetical protein P7C71_g3642, partial [Lecanoromycetidae sp. Uapishka_2]